MKHIGSRLRWLLVLAALATVICAVPAFAAEANDSFPGVPIPASPIQNRLNFHPGYSDHDHWDIYSLNLAEGDELQLSLTMPSTGCYSIDLYYAEPGAEWPRYLYSGSSVRYPSVLSYSVPKGRAGTYYAIVNNGLGEPRDGTYTLTWSKSSDQVQRLWGTSRLGTASAITRSTFTTSTAVVLANGLGYADALSASGLAGALDAPIILAVPGAYPGYYDYSRWTDDVTDVYLVGGVNALDAELETSFRENGYQVTRLAGRSRYETAARVAEKVTEITGGTDRCFVVSGAGFADALSASPIAYAQKMPIVLSSPLALSADSAACIESLGVTEVVMLGGESALSEQVKLDLEALNDSTITTERWSGRSRFETAANVAVQAEARGWVSRSYIGLANGYGFADALVGSTWIGKQGGVLLLTGPTRLDAAAATAIPNSAEKVSLFGGPAVLSATVASDASALFK